MSVFLDEKFNTLKAYTPGEQPKDFNKYIKLNTNESPFPPSPKVIEALNSGLVSRLNLYPDDSCGALVQTLAEYYNVGSENIITGNGSDEILAFCFHAFCSNGAAFADITYGFYEVYCDMFAREKEIIPLDENFEININDYVKTNKTIFIANPNAPTGIYLGLDKIKELLTQNKNRLVIVDEAYIDFGNQSALTLLGKHENLLIVRTFSKSRSLAGGRVGFAIGSGEIINDLKKMKYSFNPYSLNSLSLAAAKAAVNDDNYFSGCCEKIVIERKRVTDNLRNFGFYATDSGANFVFAGRNPKIGAEDYFNRLKEKNILIRYFKNPRIKDFVRITVGSPDQNTALLEETKKIIKNLCNA